MPTDAGRAVPGAQARRVPRHRRGELHEHRANSNDARHHRSHHQGLRRHRGGRAHHRADVGRAAATSRAWTARCAPAPGTPLEGVQLLGKTLGIIGLGGIGREVARIGKGIGMEVIAYNRTPRADANVPLVDIDTLLARSDVVSLNLVLNDETRGFLDAERIARMKPGVILVNTARGALVDEAALHRRAAKRPHPPRRARRVPRRAAQGRPPAGAHAQRDADRACRLPHAGSLDDAAAPRDRYRARRSPLAAH